MEPLCRLCLQSGSDLGPISSEEQHNEDVNNDDDASEGQTLVQLILRYLSIQVVKAENPESHFICSGCKSLIEEWHRFHKSCLKNDEIYQQRVLEQVVCVIDSGDSESLIEPIELKEENSDTTSVGDPENEPKKVASDEDDEDCDEDDDDDDDDDNDEDYDDVGSDYSTYEYEVLEPVPETKAKSKNKVVEDRRDPRLPKRGRPRVRPLDVKITKRAEVCTICGKFIKNLTEHMRIHNNERRHQCPYCAKSFVSASNYSSHVNIHTRAKMYKCDLCDKQYALLNSMKQHRITHFKERIYLCPVCGKAYYQPTGLARHKRSHFEQPTIKCSECDKMFLTNGDLRKHFKKHLPEKPFSCEICSRAFNRKDNLKTHMKTHREKASKADSGDSSKPVDDDAESPVAIKLEISKA